MKALSTALMTKFSAAVDGSGNHNDFFNDIGGRLFKGRAEEGAEYPYAVYLLVSDVQKDTFKDTLDDVTIQFSLFSSASSSGEVEDMFIHLKALFDDCSLAITGATLVWMTRQHAQLMVEDHTTPQGTTKSLALCRGLLNLS